VKVAGMSDTSRRHPSNRSAAGSWWMDPKRRFYSCLILFAIFSALQHWNWMFSLGAFGTITIHAAMALYTGDVYVRTLSLKSSDVIYQRGDSAYGIVLFLHLAILLLFLFTLLLRIFGL
jgi:hypothetical protein